MSHLSIHIHPELAEALLADVPHGAAALASIVRQATLAVQRHGCRGAYAPAVADGIGGAAMSVRRSQNALVIEIGRPGTLRPGRGIVVERVLDPRLQKRTVLRARR